MDSTFTPPDLSALERARGALTTIGSNAFLDGNLETALDSFTSAGREAPRHFLTAIGDKARDAGRFPIALRAYVAANSSEHLIACGDLLVERARSIRSRTAFTRANRQELWRFFGLAALVTVTVCVFAIAPVRQWLVGGYGLLLLILLPLLSFTFGCAWLLRSERLEDYRPYLREAWLFYSTAGAVEKVVEIGDRFLELGYEREAREAYAAAVKCAERS